MDLFNVLDLLKDILNNPSLHPYIDLIPKDKFQIATKCFTAIGVVAHLARSLYEKWQGRGHRRERLELMEEFSKTSAFLANLSKGEVELGDPQRLKTLRGGLREQLQDVSRQIAGTLPRSHNRNRAEMAAPPRPWIRRALLLYVPNHRSAWVPQVLAWVSLCGSILWLATDGVKRVGTPFFVAFYLALRAWAVTAEYWPGAATAYRWYHRWTLHFPPSSPAGWMARGLYYLVVALSVVTPAVVALDPHATRIDAFYSGAALVVLATAVGAWAQRYAPAPAAASQAKRRAIAA